MDLRILAGFRKAGNYFTKEYYWLTPPLVFLSFPGYDIFFLKFFPFWAWISLVPLFLYIKERPLKEIYVKIFGAALLSNYFCYAWIGEFGAVVPGGYLVILILLIPTLSVFLALKIFLSELLSRKFEKYRIIIFPSVWLIIDWIQSIGFLAFPWSYWGYSQYPFTPFVQTASVTGIYGITFILIMSNAVLAGIMFEIKKQGGIDGLTRTIAFKKCAVFFTTAAIIIAAGGVSLLVDRKEDSPHETMRISMVQSCIDPWDSWSMNRHKYLSELITLTDKAVKDDPDFIVWSESATLETIYYDYHRGSSTSFQKRILDYINRINIPLLTGEIGIVEKVTPFPPKRYPLNNAVLVNSRGEPEKTYSKIHLVPIGEWFPYEKWFPFVKRMAASFGASSFLPGDELNLFTVNGMQFGVLICYEGIFHRLCRRYAGKGADFLINITNDGWTDHYSGHMQHFSASVFRAVENGIWLVRAGNTGYTAFVDPRGRVTASIPILEKGYLTDEIDISANRKTVYSVTGDLVLYASMIFVFVLVFKNIIKSKRKE